MRIGIIAGEASGDVIAAGLVRELKQLFPSAIFQGIGGKHMIAEGFESIDDINKLSVMGLVEVLRHLPSLLQVRNKVLQHFYQNPPDVFIGVDAPDFNLPIEKKLKQRNIKTIHYISPTVWAWREKRIHKIAQATNLVLGIFPFESKSYERYGYAYKFIGHSLADEIPLQVNRETVRDKFGISPSETVLAVLPGSRAKEIDNLLSIFLTTASLFAKHHSSLTVIIPAANQQRLTQIRSIVSESEFSFTIIIDEIPAREAMVAANVVLLASGTASLECMLCKRPMVVAYTMSWLTYKIMQRLYIPEYFALPNILAGERLVPEFLQSDVNPVNLCKHLLHQTKDQERLLIPKFTQLHEELKRNASKEAAIAVRNLIND